MATRIGLEPTTPSVTGWCSNQLSYRAMIAQVCAALTAGTCFIISKKRPLVKHEFTKNAKKPERAVQSPLCPVPDPHSRNDLQKKNAPKSFDFRASELELLSRFELETSSLPRMRSTNRAIAAQSQLSYNTTVSTVWQEVFAKKSGFLQKVVFYEKTPPVCLRRQPPRRWGLWQYGQLSGFAKGSLSEGAGIAQR